MVLLPFVLLWCSVAIALPQGTPVGPPAPKGTRPVGITPDAIAALIEVAGSANWKDSTVNDLDNGPCRDILFIVARGSAEPGNVVRQ